MKPVFIVGPSRSGTSLLYRTLMRHSVFEAQALSLAETHLFSRPLIGADIEGGSSSNLRDYMLKDEAVYDRFVLSVKGVQHLHKLLSRSSRIHTLCEQNDRAWVAALNFRIAKRYFAFAREARGSARLVEKTPGHLHRINRIRSVFPDAKFLVTVRHPVDVYSSYIRRSQVQPDKSWLQIGVDDFVDKYYRDLDVIVDLNCDLSSVSMVVRYEDFVASPEDSFRDICNFIGEHYEGEAITGGVRELDHWKPDPHLAGPIIAETKRWQEYVSEANAARIESRLMPFMKQLGYARYTL